MQTLKKEIRSAGTANSLLVLLFVLLALGFSALTNALVKIVIPEDSAYSTSVYMLLIYVIQYVVSVPIALFVFCKLKHQPFLASQKAFFRKPQAKASQIFKWILISLALIYVTSYSSAFLINFIKSATDNTVSDISLVAEPNALGYIANIVGMFLLAPFFEEVLFRGNFFKSIESYGSWFAVLMTGITFGLWHVNIGQTLYTIMLGICTAFLVAKTGSLIPGILLHGIFNLIGTLQSIALSGVDLEQAGDFQYILDHIVPFMTAVLLTFLIFGLIIAGMVLLILELCRHRETFHLKKVHLPLTGAQTVIAYLSSPVSILTYLLLIGLTVLNAVSAG